MAKDVSSVKVAVIGSGPAGYTAAIYLSRARLKTMLFSGQEIGGQLMYTTEIENFPGFAEGIRGPQLMMNMRQQAQRFGTEVIDVRVDSIAGSANGPFTIQAGDKTYQAKAVLIATGAKSQMLGLEGEDSLIGRGLSTCAVCDAAFFKDRQVFVVGGGDSAIEDALALARFTNNVSLVHRRDSFRASQIMQERVKSNPNIKILWNSEIRQLHQENGQLSALTIYNNQTKKKDKVRAEGVFYAIGHQPATEFLGDLVQKNKQGYIITRLGMQDQSLEQAQQALNEKGWVTFLTMTSMPGIFAAGDNVDFVYRQAITAAGFGTMAALDTERWLELQAA